MPDEVTVANPKAVARPWFSTPVRWLLWAVYVALWTWSLERPYPKIVLEHTEFDWYFFLFGKAVHVTAYACFAILSAWLHAPRPYRWGLLLFMSAHAWGSEYFQQFAPTRHPSLRDVGLDHTGILLGTLLSWRWWRGR